MPDHKQTEVGDKSIFGDEESVCWIEEETSTKENDTNLTSTRAGLIFTFEMVALKTGRDG